MGVAKELLRERCFVLGDDANSKLSSEAWLVDLTDDVSPSSIGD